MMNDDAPPPPEAGFERLSRLDELFEQALDLPASDRGEFVAGACAADPEGRERLERLLRLAATGGGLLDTGSALPAEILERWLEDDSRLAAGTSLGPYDIVREIGRGGMGVVYLAHRADGLFRRHAALKLLKRGLDTDEILGRFARERQILAGLSHPAIAGLVDAGMSGDGRPYLVMDYVEGVPVDRFCDERSAPLEARLRLFVVIAEAVAYAHRNLVIHRDIKPANILVEPDGSPKLLDFGIAKLIDPAGAPVDATRTHERLLTPRYASPEQLAGEPVNTATDVYQLGLLLCELLCGALPEPLRKVDTTESGVSMHALLARGSGPEAQAVAGSRGTAPARLRRKLRGDLETIVAVATHPDPRRRYKTAEALAEDVRRHLEVRPIAGRTDSLAYRAGRFVTRHPWGVAAFAAVCALTVAYAVTATVQGRRLAAERDRVRAEAAKVEQVTDVLSDLLRRDDPYQNQDGIPELLARGRERIDALTGQPEVQAELWTLLGEIHANRGEPTESLELLERALAIREDLLGFDGRPTLHTANLLGTVYTRLGRFDDAKSLLLRALEARRRVDGPRHSSVSQVLSNLGGVAFRERDFASAVTYLEEAQSIVAEQFTAADFQTAESLRMLGAARGWLGDSPRAEADLRRAAAIFADVFDADHPQVGNTWHDLATIFHRQGNRDAAREQYVAALAIKRRSLGPDSYELASTRNNLGVLLLELGEYSEAGEHLNDALRLKRTQLGADHPAVASTLVNLGIIATELRRFDDAAKLLAEARRIRVTRLGEDSVTLLVVDLADAELALRRNRLGEAAARVEGGLGRVLRHDRESAGEAAELRVVGGRVELAGGEPRRAETILRVALESTLKRVAPDTLEAANVRLHLGRALHRQHRQSEAQAELRLALEIYERQAPKRAAAARELLAGDGILLAGLPPA